MQDSDIDSLLNDGKDSALNVLLSISHTNELGISHTNELGISHTNELRIAHTNELGISHTNELSIAHTDDLSISRTNELNISQENWITSHAELNTPHAELNISRMGHSVFCEASSTSAEVVNLKKELVVDNLSVLDTDHCFGLGISQDKGCNEEELASLDQHCGASESSLAVGFETAGSPMDEFLSFGGAVLAAEEVKDDCLLFESSKDISSPPLSEVTSGAAAVEDVNAQMPSTCQIAAVNNEQLQDICQSSSLTSPAIVRRLHEDDRALLLSIRQTETAAASLISDCHRQRAHDSVKTQIERHCSSFAREDFESEFAHVWQSMARPARQTEKQQQRVIM